MKRRATAGWHWAPSWHLEITQRGFQSHFGQLGLATERVRKGKVRATVGGSRLRAWRIDTIGEEQTIEERHNPW